MKLRWLLLIGALVFVVTLVTQAPVAVLYAWLKPAGGVQLMGLEGSVMQGRAAAVQVDGRVAMEDVVWTLHPLPLLAGRAAFDVSSGKDALLMNGRITAVPGGFNADGLRATGALKQLLAAAGQAFLPVDGQAGLELTSLRVRKGLPQSAEGRLSIRGLSSQLGQPLLLGDFQADITPESDGIKALITTLAGPLDASGEARLKQDRSYTLDLRLRSKPDADPALVRMLPMLGKPDAQGNYRIQRGGRLAEPAPPPTADAPDGVKE